MGASDGRLSTTLSTLFKASSVAAGIAAGGGAGAAGAAVTAGAGSGVGGFCCAVLRLHPLMTIVSAIAATARVRGKIESMNRAYPRQIGLLSCP